MIILGILAIIAGFLQVEGWANPTLSPVFIVVGLILFFAGFISGKKSKTQ